MQPTLYDWKGMKVVHRCGFEPIFPDVAARFHTASHGNIVAALLLACENYNNGFLPFRISVLDAPSRSPL